MYNFETGDLVKICRQPVGFSELEGVTGTVVSLEQEYWDYGSGEYGYVDIAKVMTETGVLSVALKFLSLA